MSWELRCQGTDLGTPKSLFVPTNVEAFRNILLMCPKSRFEKPPPIRGQQGTGADEACCHPTILLPACRVCYPKMLRDPFPCLPSGRLQHYHHCCLRVFSTPFNHSQHNILGASFCSVIALAAASYPQPLTFTTAALSSRKVPKDWRARKLLGWRAGT